MPAHRRLLISAAGMGIAVLLASTCAERSTHEFGGLDLGHQFSAVQGTSVSKPSGTSATLDSASAAKGADAGHDSGQLISSHTVMKTNASLADSGLASGASAELANITLDITQASKVKGSVVEFELDGQSATGLDDGLCHCMHKSIYKDAVDWDDFETFYSQGTCFIECPRICVHENKTVGDDYPFFTCRPKDGEFQCNCMDFKDTAKRMGLSNRNDVYQHAFIKWNWNTVTGVPSYHSRFPSVAHCVAECHKECFHAAIMDPNQHGLYKGVCTTSKHDLQRSIGHDNGSCRAAVSTGRLVALAAMWWHLASLRQ